MGTQFAISGYIDRAMSQAEPQLRMMIREVAQILGREILAEEWNSLP